MPRMETDYSMELDHFPEECTIPDLNDEIDYLSSGRRHEQEANQTDDGEIREPPRIVATAEKNVEHLKNGWSLPGADFLKSENDTDNPTGQDFDMTASASLKRLSSPELMSWHDSQNLKIRYTRQYLLDRKSEPLSTTFPYALFRFLESGEVPLREPDSQYDYRSMDHILFYTSLPYTRMRNSINACARRKPLDPCF